MTKGGTKPLGSRGAPLDKPFVCKRGHVTEAGWTCSGSYRCHTCFRNRNNERQRRYRRTASGKIAFKRGNNRKIILGLNAINCRKYYMSHREQSAERKRILVAGWRAAGRRRENDDWIGLTPRQMARVEAGLEI